MKATISLFGCPIEEIDLPDDYILMLPHRLSAFLEEARILGCEVDMSSHVVLLENLEPEQE